MLTYFKIENFRSFENTEIIFTSENSAFPPANVSIIFGNNASGKTTLIRAIDFLKSIFSSFQAGTPPANLLFAHKDNQEKLIKLSCEFIIFGDSFWYENTLKVDNKIIESIEESLDVTPYKARHHLDIFKYNSENDDTDYQFSSYLTRKKFEDVKYKVYADRFLEQVKKIKTISKKLIDYQKEVAEALMQDGELKKSVKSLMSNLDLHIDNIEEQRPDFLSSNVFIKFYHGDLDQYLPIEQESHGTQGLYILLYFILDTLRNDAILLIDEIESAIHPDIVELLIKIINKKKLKKRINYPQFIFTSHQIELMKCLYSKRNIFLSEKNERGASRIQCADDFDGIASVRDSYKKYKKGRLGAIPTLTEKLNQITKDLRKKLDS